MSPIKAFEFATATRIIFGAGKVAQVAEIAATMGQRILLVSSNSAAPIASQLEHQLGERGLTITRYTVSGEPDIPSIEGGVQAARYANCDMVIGIGGGSVIDAGKAIAGLLTNGGNVLDYVEVVGRGQPIQQPAAPYMAIPTTAGTGAEVTRNAVISIPEKQVKVSMRSPYLLPSIALIDPQLTYTMPSAVTASTGMDTLTQLIEAYTCNRTNPITDAITVTGLSNAVKALLETYEHGTPQARESMAYASLCSGLALANSGLGAVHGFAAVLGGNFPIPHGVCCAALLPYVTRGNIAALLARDPANEALVRYNRIALLLTGGQDPQQLPDALLHLSQALHIPRLSTYGVSADAVPELVSLSMQANSMKANPIALTADELAQILTAAL
ncbi:MAG: iron-containing alcohol dehydrogenase [Chloroflexota bacterium]